MRIFLTGATGFQGRALVLRLTGLGHTVSAWVRDPGRARSQLGADVHLVDAAGGPAAMTQAVEQVDAVINLAGEPIAGGRWTRQRRARIEGSRIQLTNQLVDALAAAGQRPAVLISASAVGFYGDRGDEPLDESSARGVGYLSDVCVAWERAAMRAEALGLRVLRVRLGVVLGLQGGFLGRLLPLARRGLGTSLGDGRQWLPWIHLDDVIDVLSRALTDPQFSGVVDLVAPQPVRMIELMTALASAVGRRLLPHTPAPLLRLALGQAAEVVLGSQRLQGTRLAGWGHRVRFPTIDAALADLLGRSAAVQIQRLGQAPAGAAVAPSIAHPYLQQRPPRFVLRSQVVLDAPLAQVFAFFSRPQNLGLLTPPAMSFQIGEVPATVDRGSIIDYQLRVAGLPVRWRTAITHWDPAGLFVDAQQRGPYRSWWHEHHFRADGQRTIMEDRVFYALPAGPAGTVAHSLFVASQLRDVFGYRSQAIGQRFPALIGDARPRLAPAGLPTSVRPATDSRPGAPPRLP